MILAKSLHRSYLENMSAPIKSSSKKTEAYFHIYNIGIESRKLFNDNQDYEVFLGFLKDYLTTPPNPEKTKKTFSVKGRTYKGIPHQLKNYFNQIELIGYNLMPDHFHLLVNEKTKGALEKLIRSLCTRYVIYYNKKYKRTGSLFAGPYKSIKIERPSELLYLSRFLHRENLKEKDKGSNRKYYSSYEIYLKIPQDSWVKPQVVLSYFKKSKNDEFKGSSYVSFVEIYELQQKEKEIVERIIIESKPRKSVEKKFKLETVKSEPVLVKEVSSPSVTRPRSRLPEFLAISVAVFMILFSVGFQNVRIYASETSDSISSIPSPSLTPAPEVSGVKDIKPEEKPKEEVKEDVEKQADVEKEPKKILTVVISDGSESVNIRKKPTTSSKKIDEANDGDTFEFVTLAAGWYEIKLDNGSIAYISAKYVKEDN